MLKLYFSGTANLVSTLLIIGFGVFFTIVTTRRSSISHWGILVLVIFFIGLFMSMMSGFKDNMGAPSALFQPNSISMIVLCVLGGLCFIIGIVMLIIRKQDFWQIGFYILSCIIIAKTVMVEIIRLFNYINRI